jgi:hypothetical protein
MEGQHTELAIAVHAGIWTDESSAQNRIQELLLYLTCKVDGAGPQGQRIGTVTFSRRAEKTTQPAFSITRKGLVSPFFPTKPEH